MDTLLKSDSAKHKQHTLNEKSIQRHLKFPLVHEPPFSVKFEVPSEKEQVTIDI